MRLDFVIEPIKDIVQEEWIKSHAFIALFSDIRPK